MLTIAQTFLFVLTLLPLVLVVKSYRQRRIGTPVFFLWLLLWVGVAVVILFPAITVEIAGWLDIGRGADLVLYLGMIGLFYLLFKVGMRLERMDREITQIVRALALNPR